MKRHETLETLFSKADLSFAQKVLTEPYHPADSPGRPPRNPLGIFKAHIIKRLRHIPSDRMLVRQMWKDPRLKKICDIEANQPPYGIAVLSRFRSKVGPERLARILDNTIEMLVKKGRIKGKAVALDSTFIKAYSRRNLDNRTGYSDPESRIGRASKAKDLGYRVHLAVDVKSELPIAIIVVSANENEKKHSISLFRKASEYVKPGKLLADCQYSAANLRETASECGTLPVIPYPRNQQKGVRGILRVDRKFRSHGPRNFKLAYRRRVAVERVFSRLKLLAGLGQHSLRGLAKVTFHSQLCIIAMLLTAEAAVNSHKPNKSRCIRYFAN
ncbi:MAG: transposase [Crenarchaeota archaeon]|nr:transposase [Thermoproteota archaeon]